MIFEDGQAVCFESRDDGETFHKDLESMSHRRYNVFAINERGHSSKHQELSEAACEDD